jgi:hypothetical protein
MPTTALADRVQAARARIAVQIQAYRDLVGAAGDPL